MSQRIIMVCGYPSGGTSAVAGILHRLGVPMGNVKVNPNRKGRRKYAMYECKDLKKWYLDQVWPARSIKPLVDPDRAVAMFDGYLHKFRSGEEIVGVKHPRLNHLLLSQNLGRMGVEVVRVIRDMEDVIHSEVKYTGRKDRLADRMCRLGYHRYCFDQRVGGHMDTTIPFSVVLEDPRGAANSLCRILHLSSTVAQIDDAEAFIQGH